MEKQSMNEIRRLGQLVEEKRQVFEFHQTRNVWGKSPQERLEMSGAFAQAQAELFNAQRMLEEEMRKPQ